MIRWLTSTLFSAALLLAACLIFPRFTFSVAYVIVHAPIYGAVLVLSLVMLKSSFVGWWHIHIQLKGVGGKSGWQVGNREVK